MFLFNIKYLRSIVTELQNYKYSFNPTESSILKLISRNTLSVCIIQYCYFVTYSKKLTFMRVFSGHGPLLTVIIATSF
jgi:hypothetical protein